MQVSEAYPGFRNRRNPRPSPDVDRLFHHGFTCGSNMAPLASSMLASADWLTRDDIPTVCHRQRGPDHSRPHHRSAWRSTGGDRGSVFSVLMVTMAVPSTVFFAFGTTATQLFVARLVMSSVGASFVVGIHMTALWFKPRDIGFAEGFYAGWGNFGSAAAAMTIPTVALGVFGGDDGWRYAVAMSGVIIGRPTAYSTGSRITDGPTADTHTEAAQIRCTGSLELPRSCSAHSCSLCPWSGFCRSSSIGCS